MGAHVYLRLIISLLCSILVYVSSASAARYASIIVDEKSGTVLHAVNPDRKIYPASLAKMMTLYLVFENLRLGKLQLGTQLKVSRRAARRPKSKVGVRRGSTITVKQSIKALVTKSANDVATVIAESLGGTEENFARLMTKRAYHLGMSRSIFKNASGLPNKSQISTARDMAILSIALRRDFPKYFKYFTTKKFYYRGRTHGNHNKLLRRLPGTDGIKTGYIRASGFNIAVSVKYKGRRLVGTFFGGRSASRRDRHAITIFKRVFLMLDEMDKTKRRNRIAVKENAPRLIFPSGLSRSAMPSKSIIRRVEKEAVHSLWSLQVGAFDKFTTAHLAASRASKIAPGLRRTRISVKLGANRGKRIYRARLVGLPKLKAKKACRFLKRRKITCLLIREKRSISEGDQ